MRGIRKSLATRAKECLPLGIYVHCYGHLLNLALQDTMTEIKTLRNAVGTIQSLYNFLQGSTKRHALFIVIHALHFIFRPRLGGLPHLPVVPHLRVKRP